MPHCRQGTRANRDKLAAMDEDPVGQEFQRLCNELESKIVESCIVTPKLVH